MTPKETEYENQDWRHLAYDKAYWRYDPLGFIKRGKSINYWKGH
jgi:hypothetical protein